MHIYWYWPFAREEDIALARATPGPDDTLVVHALDRPGAPRASTARVTIRAELPDVPSVGDGSLRWAVSRIRTYTDRARRRQAAIRQGGFDVAHIAFLNQYTDTVLLRSLARRVPIVTTVHDVLPHHSRLPAPVQHRVLAALYAACGEIVVHHDDVGTELTERFSIPPARIHVVPHWVSPFRNLDDDRALSGAHRVLCFGTLRRNKGIPDLLAAIDRIGPDAGVSFHIAGRGDPDLEQAVAAAAARHAHVTAEIAWITPERKIALLEASDLAVLPYTSFASQSGVLHDAFGSHLPAVVTDVGALRASVERTGAGWSVPPGRVDALADAIVAAFADPVAWKRASDAARRVAIEQSPQRVGAALRAVYETVAVPRHRPVGPTRS